MSGRFIRVLKLAVTCGFAAMLFGPVPFDPVRASSKPAPATKAAPPPVPPPAADIAPALTGESGPAAAKVVEIPGFRSAHFGMTESEVRKGIRSDFGNGDSEIVTANDDLDKTTSLQVAVDDLLSVSGKGKISYVFGFQSKKLIQVNIAWGAAAGVERSSEALIDAADMLRAHFLTKPFRPADMLLNWQLADGSTVVFRGKDRHHHVVLLVLAGEKLSAPTDSGGAPLVPALKITTLMLSYIEDIERPDDFHLKPEAF